jgi:hypothetical protein
MIKCIHLALEVKTSFGNSTPTMSSNTKSSTLKLALPIDRHQWLRPKIEKRRNLHTKSYKAKLEQLRSARLTRRGQVVKFLDMRRLQVVKDT